MRAHIPFPALRPLVRRSAVAALGAGVIVLAGCGGGPLEVEPVREDEPDAVIADLPDETDPAALAEASAVLQKVPGGVATPIDGGILFGGTGGTEGETFGFPSGPPASSGGLGFGSSDGGGGGESFGSSNADATAGDGLSGAGEALGDAAGAAAAVGSGLVGSGRDTVDRAAGAAAAAGSSEGGSFGFRSDGGGNDGSFGFRDDGSAAPGTSAGPASGSAIDTTPGAVVATPGATLPGGDGNSFGYRVDQPRTTPPRSFGYAGPPRPQDQVPTPAAAAPGPSPAAVSAPPPGAIPVIVSGVPVDTPLPPSSPTLPAPRSVPAPTPASSPGTVATPVAARSRLWGCAPARRPAAAPRLRVLSSSQSGLRSVAFVCLPAGVRPEFNGWLNGRGVARITQTADAGDIYEIPRAQARRAGIGLPANVLAAHPELRAVPEPVTAFAGFDGTQALTSSLLRRPHATFSEATPAALRRVHPADLDRLGASVWATLPVRDLRKLPTVRWSQLSPRTIAAVAPARRAQLAPAARRAIAARGL